MEEINYVKDPDLLKIGDWVYLHFDQISENHRLKPGIYRIIKHSYSPKEKVYTGFNKEAHFELAYPNGEETGRGVCVVGLELINNNRAIEVLYGQ